jgi:hypothetical protein
MLQLKHFCLVTSDSKDPAYEIFEDRIKENLWPLYNKTPFLSEINKDDYVTFYIAGNKKNKKTFVASAQIKQFVIPSENIVDPNKTKKIIKKYLVFKNINIFKNPIDIYSIIQKLSFIKNKKHYGAYLVGGVAKINEDDFEKIISIV